MNAAKAMSIFIDINNPKYTEQEKVLAIHIVLEMPTHNSITKYRMLKVINWLWNEHYEWKEKD